MTTVTRPGAVLALIVLSYLAPATAHAQDQRFRVSFEPAVATVSGDAELALAGSVGYRFSKSFWFEGELTWIDAAAGGFGDSVLDLDLPESGLGDLRDILGASAGRFGSGRPGGFGSFTSFPALTRLSGGLGQFRAAVDGRTLVGTIGIRYEMPVETTRFRPYLSGGIGINNTEHEIDIERLVSSERIEDGLSHTGYAFNAGAGASLRLVRSLWADVDAKYFRLSQDRNVMRFGGGVSFRF